MVGNFGKTEKPLHCDGSVRRAFKQKERRAAGWSQKRLGASLGMSFQQVQKYENGTNRVAVSTLLLIAEALERPMTDFLP
ncbi:MAG: helix-turn-helix domain-containing protein [Propylenella sp.]